MITPTAAPRYARGAAVGVALALLALVGVAPSADAAGTGGVVVVPVPAMSHGKPVTAFHVTLPTKGQHAVPFVIRNVASDKRSARIYIAAVVRTPSGYRLGTPGSSPYAKLPPRTVTLRPGEVRESSFTLHGGRLPEKERLAAVVVEVQNGAVLQRASTLVYFTRGRPWNIPLIALVAAALVVLLGAAVISARSRERSRFQPQAA